MNEQGRITIPFEVRSLLELRNSKVVITVISGGEEVGTVINVDESGRATIPKQTRRYLGIDGDERELRLIIERR
jgi:bifunctional DNA-binding transcriptional regulator/antitoxin component of YhaV-PrlF toxin-antitoxin module